MLLRSIPRTSSQAGIGRAVGTAGRGCGLIPDAPVVTLPYFIVFDQTRRPLVFRQKPMRERKITLIGLLLAAVLAVLALALHPLRRSPEHIQARLEKETPLGSSYESVLAHVKAKGWYHPDRQGSDGNTKGRYIRCLIGETQF